MFNWFIIMICFLSTLTHNSNFTVVSGYEDDFFIQDLIVNMLFSNYKFTSNPREAFLIDSFS